MPEILRAYSELHPPGSCWFSSAAHHGVIWSGPCPPRSRPHLPTAIRPWLTESFSLLPGFRIAARRPPYGSDGAAHRAWP